MSIESQLFFVFLTKKWRELKKRQKQFSNNICYEYKKLISKSQVYFLLICFKVLWCQYCVKRFFGNSRILDNKLTFEIL